MRDTTTAVILDSIENGSLEFSLSNCILHNVNGVNLSSVSLNLFYTPNLAYITYNSSLNAKIKASQVYSEHPNKMH